MAKLKATEVDSAGILERMRVAAAEPSLAGLAGKLGISPQAIQQTRARASISLSLLLAGAELGDVSLDYLVFGSAADSKASREKRYAQIKMILGSSTENDDVVLFDKTWLQNQLRGKPAENLRQIVVSDAVYIFDVTINTLDDGYYVVGHDEENITRICECRKMIDGAIEVKGDDKSVTQEIIEKIGIVGKVVWRGSAV